MTPCGLTRRDDGIHVLALDRAPVNAMNLELLEAVIDHVEAIRADPPSALILTGANNVFSAGADLKAVPAGGPDVQRAMVRAINEMAIGLYALPVPVVVAITGHAIAGGLVLALTGDVRIASWRGRYGLTEVKVGFPYPRAALGVVEAELTPHVARLLTLGNQLYEAEDCRRMGIFDEILEPLHVMDRAVAYATELASFPADVYARTKRDLRGATAARLRELADADPLA